MKSKINKIKKIAIYTVGALVVFAFFAAITGHTARAQILEPPPNISLWADPTRVNPGDNVKLTWETLNYDPDSCFMSATNFDVGPAEFSGNKTVNPTLDTTYKIKISCFRPFYTGNVEASASAIVKVGNYQYLNIAQRPPIVPNSGSYSEGYIYFCPSKSVVCGTYTQTPGYVKGITCCSITPEAKSYGVDFPNPHTTNNSHWIDSDNDSNPWNEGNLWCPPGEILVGAEWAKSGQVDHGWCRALPGIELTDGSYHSSGQAITLCYADGTDKDDILYGAKNAVDKNDQWGGFYCARTLVDIPAPDLTASLVTPATAAVGIPQQCTSTISNIGSASTGSGFYNLFQIATEAGGGGTITDLLPAKTMPALAARTNGTAYSPFYTFSSVGTSSIRACADKSSSSNTGAISELNENNNCGAWTNVTITPQPVVNCESAGNGTGLLGKYYSDNAPYSKLNDKNLVTTRIDSTINFNPADFLGSSYAGSSDGDTFSVRWEGQVQPKCSENYTFHTITDDGVRLWVNGNLVIADGWVLQSATEWSSDTIPLLAGIKYNIKMEYYEETGDAVAQLFWSSPSTVKGIIPQTQLYPLSAYPLYVSKSGSGSGTVISTYPAGIDCGETCEALYEYGVSVNLRATPDSNSTFAEWLGDCSGTSNSCIVSMTQTRKVAATFNDNTIIEDPILSYNLYVIKSGQGIVGLNPVGGACSPSSPTCWSYAQDDEVTLTAVANPGRIFTSWGGDCKTYGKNPDCSLKMNSSKSVTANFIINSDNYGEF